MTTLSFKKLYALIENCKFYNHDFYTINGMCVFVKLISKIDFNTYILYIPSKYDINMKNYKSYELKNINNISTSNDIVLEYGYDNENKNRENMYHDHGSHKDVNETNLLENYRSEININNVKSKDNEEVKCLYRQMKRLKYSVENLDYKLVITYKTYLCVIGRDNNISCYFIKNYNGDNNQHKSIQVCMNLELLFNKNHRIHSELIQVKAGIEKIINKNYVINTKYINNLVQNSINVSSMHNLIINKKNKINDLYDKVKKLLDQVCKKEEEIKKTHNNTEVLNNTLQVKAKLVINLNKIINERDNLVLLYDKILFDNIIMLDKITKNINLLNQI